MQTARAPIASALTMSVPRRKPRIDQHRHAAADRLEDLGQRVDGRAAAILGAAAMVGHDDAVEPVVDGEHGVLGRHQPLQHQPRLHRVAQALDELPGEVGGAGAGDARDVEPVEVGLALDEARQAERRGTTPQFRVSVRHSRTSVSQFWRASTSTVTTMVSAPAFSARRARRLGHLPFVRSDRAGTRPAGRAPRSPARSRSWPRSRGSAGDRRLRAARATASSPSSWKALVGRRSAPARSGWHRSRRTVPCAGRACSTSTSRRGRSWNFWKPSRLARRVTSSSMPVAM